MSDTPTPQPTSETQPSERRGITRIRVDGFKSLRNAEIEVRPLTILAGANSSGKSAIMQPLLLTKQTLESPYDAGALLLKGENVNFTSAAQFWPVSLSQEPTSPISFQVMLKVSDATWEAYFSYLAETGEIDLVENRYPNLPGGVLSVSPHMTSQQIQQLISKIDKSYSSEASAESSFEWTILQNGPFLDFRHGNEGFTGSYLLTSRFREAVLHIIHVPGLRGTPERSSASVRSIATAYPGRFDKYTASILNAWRKENDSNLIHLSRMLAHLGLTSLANTVQLNAAEIEIRVGRTLTSASDDLGSLADVGFGVSQVLPVLVALLAAQPGQLVYIEQPELHLHPRAQHTLAAFIAEAAARGARLVIETHSDILLRGIQTQVVKYELGQGGVSKEDVVLHWFTRSDDGLTQIRTAYMNADGAYGDWPVDFAEVDLNAQGDYLDTVAEKHFGAREHAETHSD
jgi:hypothetical protein